MTYLAMFIVGVGCLVIGAALSARRLANEHDQVERTKLELDETRWRLQRERDDLARQQAMLRDSLHLEPPAKEPRVSFDLGAYRRRRGLVQ